MCGIYPLSSSREAFFGEQKNIHPSLLSDICSLDFHRFNQSFSRKKIARKRPPNLRPGNYINHETLWKRNFFPMHKSSRSTQWFNQSSGSPLSIQTIPSILSKNPAILMAEPREESSRKKSIHRIEKQWKSERAADRGLSHWGCYYWSLIREKSLIFKDCLKDSSEERRVLSPIEM